MGVESQMFSVRVDVNVIVALADKFAIERWGEAAFALDISGDHGL